LNKPDVTLLGKANNLAKIKQFLLGDPEIQQDTMLKCVKIIHVHCPASSWYIFGNGSSLLAGNQRSSTSWDEAKRVLDPQNTTAQIW
jgi:hypothetical protein